MVTKLNITLPPLHKGRFGDGGQVEIANDTNRFKVIVCGRRWGKTTLGVLLCVKTALEGGRVWWVAPTYKIANEGWTVLRSLAQQIPETKVLEGDHTAIFPSGGRVEVRSADIIGSLRGAGLDGVVLDEFATCRETTWTEELRPSLTDKKGWAVFIGTPRGKNWASRLYDYAGKANDWSRYKKPTIDNPFIDLIEVEEARALLPLSVFRQEYEADFGASQLQVYPDFDREFHSYKEDKLPKFDIYFGGLDFGGTSIGSHKSAGILGGYSSELDTLIELFHFEESGPNIAERQLNWMAECEANIRIAKLRAGDKSPTPIVWTADKTQMGFIQALRSTGFTMRSSKGGKDSVLNGIALVQKRLETRGDGKPRLYYLPPMETFCGAVERYRYPNFPDDERPVSANPLKVNDDTVDSFRYQVEGIDRTVMGNPEELYKNVLPGVR